MSAPINPSGTLQAAQAATYFKGQEVQQRESKEEKEKRLLNLQLKEARKQMQKPSASGKGVLA
jgi:hypothetical protein